jgi:hypothetical protein
MGAKDKCPRAHKWCRNPGISQVTPTKCILCNALAIWLCLLDLGAIGGVLHGLSSVASVSADGRQAP